MTRVAAMLLHGSINGVGKPATLHKESLEFENVELAQRSYK